MSAELRRSARESDSKDLHESQNDVDAGTAIKAQDFFGDVTVNTTTWL